MLRLECRSVWVTAMLAAAAYDISAQSIYTCVDARGRKLTSDRPIAECMDREQLELNPSGTVRRRVAPSFTAKERAEQEARERKLAEEQARLAEDKRRDRALLIRYPTQAAHDQERRDALAQVDGIIVSMRKRIAELRRQRAAMDDELEFYKKEPAKAPAVLKRLIEDNAQDMAMQHQYIADQENEKKRINARFDEELQKLRALWASSAPSAAHVETAPASAR